MLSRSASTLRLWSLTSALLAGIGLHRFLAPAGHPAPRRARPQYSVAQAARQLDEADEANERPMRPTRPTDNKDDEDDEENNDDDPAYRRLLPKSTMTQLARGCRQCSSGAHHRGPLTLASARRSPTRRQSACTRRSPGWHMTTTLSPVMVPTGLLDEAATPIRLLLPTTAEA